MSTALIPEPDTHAAHGAAPSCPNCQTVTHGNFCHHCGQETVLHHASTREFLHEFIGHYVALEGRLWGTMGRLLFRPGALTNEYIKGRRVRFVQPLRLYLTLSVLFFALMKLSGSFDPPVEPQAGSPVVVKQAGAGADGVVVAKDAETAARAKPAGTAVPDHPAQAVNAGKRSGSDKPVATDKAAKDNPDNNIDIDEKTVEDWLSGMPRLNHQLKKFESLPMSDKKRVLIDGFYNYAPLAIFCLMPIFALYLKVLYLGSGRRYGEHLLFALHSNAFAFVMMMCLLLPLPGIVKFVFWMWLLGYLPWAMRRVYNSSRFGVAWRWMTLMFFYSITLGMAILVAGGAGIVLAH